jgi:hypothetical protein
MKSSSTSAASSGGSGKRKPAKPKPRPSLAKFPPKLKIPRECRIVGVDYVPNGVDEWYDCKEHR